VTANDTAGSHPACGGGFLLGASDPARIFVPEAFGEDALMLASSVEEFVRDRVIPNLDRIDAKEDGLLEALVREAGQLGIFAVDVPESYGGLGAAKTTAILVAERVGLGASFAPAVAVQTGIGGLPILYFGTDAQRARWVERIISGELITAYGLTEADSGSDALGARTTAHYDADRDVYLLNGAKQFITNAGFADLFIVFAKVEGQRFTAFVVERNADGFTVGREESKLGLHGSSTCALSFVDTPVPSGNVLGRIGEGHKIAFNVLNIGRLKLSPGVVGGAKVSLATGARYALGRQQFKRPISEFPLIQQKLAAACSRIYCAESMVYRTSHEIDRHVEAAAGDDSSVSVVAALRELSVECSINKVYASEMLDFVVDEMLQIHGGYGFMTDYPAERHYRDARIHRIWEGTSEINRMLITGMLMKRATKGSLALLPAMKSVTSELMGRRIRRDRAAGAFASEFESVEFARKQTLFAAGAAAQAFQASLAQEQEVLALLADMVIQTYAMESAVLRAVRVVDLVSPGDAALRRSAARLAIEVGMPIVRTSGRHVLTSSAAGDERRTMLTMHRKLTRREPFDVRTEGRALAAAVIAAEGYPF
jgi:alkylation response protein AidB-like acyl-CoA dehydrogenase